MKKIFRIFLLTVAAFFVLLNAVACGETEKPLRLHIRADGNEKEAQDVKLKVRDETVKFLTPLLSSAKSIDEAKEIFVKNADVIEKLCDETLKRNGFNYGAKVLIGREYFPSRSYGGKVYRDGYYDAVIINLGSGKGDNWWCVAYPPLCFDSDAGEYRSAIWDYFNSRRNNDGK